MHDSMNSWKWERPLQVNNSNSTDLQRCQVERGGLAEVFLEFEGERVSAEVWQQEQLLYSECVLAD